MSLYALPLDKYQRRTRTDSIVIHCSATAANQDIGADVIRQWHVRERGWIDIGYTDVIRRDGSLELGRPWWAVGAGVAGWNADSIHICLVGGGAKMASNNFTPGQWRTLRALVLRYRELDPGAERILGHRDFPGVTKSCPAFDVRTWLEEQGIPVVA